MTADAVCPTCREPIDPARAPIARIRDGHVLTFCSSACADGKAVARAPSPEPAPKKKKKKAKAAPVAPEPQKLVERSATEPVATSSPAIDAGWDDLPDDPLVQAAVPERKRLGKRHALMLAGVIMVGGMAIAVIEAVSPSSPSSVAASTDAEPQARAAEPAPPAPVDPADVEIDEAKLAQTAVEALREMMNSTSSRANVRRAAAVALARRKDPDAVAVLVEGLETEERPLERVRIAYALARAGDERGVAALVEALKDKRRDLRLDAARALARLGNDSGRSTLRGMLRVRTHKVGAAGVLALLGDAEGFALLRDTLETGRGPEVRMRAAVFLGLAGDENVRDRLREILLDGSYRVRAASALAVLGDTDAIPALVEQLGATSMRVDAALSLKRLGADVDYRPLAVALLESDATGRVTAAEAILILTAESNPADGKFEPVELP